MVQVYWVKSTSGTYLGLHNLDLSNITAFGVYVIWKTGQPGPVVRVGQGIIKDRLIAHRSDPQIIAHQPLFVTWASVSAAQADGIERFLADHYKPLVGAAFPDALPIPVNLVA